MPAMSTSVNSLGVNGVIADGNVELDVAIFLVLHVQCAWNLL